MIPYRFRWLLYAGIATICAAVLLNATAFLLALGFGTGAAVLLVVVIIFGLSVAKAYYYYSRHDHGDPRQKEMMMLSDAMIEMEAAKGKDAYDSKQAKNQE